MKRHTVCLTKKELRSLKNRAEMPLYFLCALVNAAAVIFVIASIVTHSGFGFAYYAAFAYLFIGFVISLGSTFSSARLNAIEITEEQFGEIYETARDFARVLGIRKMPHIYVMQNGGTLNAFASYFFFKNYVLINSDVFDVAYLKNRDIEALSFVLAHEMAHIAFCHTKIWFNFGILIAKYIPFLFPSLSRAMEYSCDNVAKYLCPDGIHGVFIMLAGKHLYDKIDAEVYLKQAESTSGWFEFYGNLTSTHPAPVRRIPALYGRAEQRIF